MKLTCVASLQLVPVPFCAALCSYRILRGRPRAWKIVVFMDVACNFSLHNLDESKGMVNT
jgi:hypothetical protein